MVNTEMQNADHFNCLSEEMCTERIAALDEAYASECIGIVLKAQASIARNHEPPALVLFYPLHASLRKAV